MTNTVYEVAQGCAVKSLLVLNNTTPIQVSANAGAVLGIEAFNNSTTIAYLKIYDNAAYGTTAGVGTPKARYMIPASSGFVLPQGDGYGIAFGIAYTVTTGIADTDTSNPSASAYIINIRYK